MKLEPLIAANSVAPQGQTQTQLSSELRQLLNQLKATLGVRLQATVNAVSELPAETQRELQKYKQQTTTAVEARAWQTLLARPSVQIVELAVKGQVFSAVTDQAVKPGQVINVIISQRGVQLLSQPAVTDISHKLELSAQVTALTSKLAATAPLAPQAHLPAKNPLVMPSLNPAIANAQAADLSHAASPTAARQTAAPTAAPILAAAVAKVLPLAKPAPEFLTVATRLLALMHSAPADALPPLLRPLLPLLKALDRQALSVDSNTPLAPATIAKAINSNGIFREQNELKTFGTPRQTGETTPPETHDLKSLLVRLSADLSQMGAGQSAVARSIGSTDAIARLWLGLVNNSSAKAQTTAKATAKDNLLQLTHSVAQGALAKIQLNQYRSLGSLSAEGAQPNSVLHLDIPIRWPDIYGNAYLQIIPPGLKEERQESKKSAMTKRKRWRVYMELELAAAGSLAVELSVSENSIGATFWAEKDELRKQAAAQLQQLHSDLSARGLQVTDLRCAAHPPPAQKMNLDYALIDVRT